jgi:hypothetical protein
MVGRMTNPTPIPVTVIHHGEPRPGSSSSKVADTTESPLLIDRLDELELKMVNIEEDQKTLSFRIQDVKWEIKELRKT